MPVRARPVTEAVRRKQARMIFMGRMNLLCELQISTAGIQSPGRNWFTVTSDLRHIRGVTGGVFTHVVYTKGAQTMPTGVIQDDSPTPQLSSDALRAYAFAVNRIRFFPEELAESLGMDPDAAKRAIDELEGLHLLGRVLDNPNELTPVPPESAAAQVLTPLEQEAQRRQRVIDEIRARLQSLIPQYEAGAAHRRRSECIEVVTDLASVRSVIMSASLRCTTEVLTAQPGGGRRTEVLEEAIVRDEQMLRRGVSMRTIYQHTAQYSQPTLTYVERTTQLGARVRTVGDGLHRMLVFDRSMAIIEVRDDPNAALVVREPSLIEFMCTVFEQTWLRALPFATRSLSREQAKALSGQVRQSIAGLLAEGLDDKSIARRLGMSERTCQRHISEIMSRIRARSRFQAGYLLRNLQDG